MMQKIKRPVSILLALMMVISVFAIVPVTASAAIGTLYDSGDHSFSELKAGDYIVKGDSSVFDDNTEYTVVLQGGTFCNYNDVSDAPSSDLTLVKEDTCCNIFTNFDGDLVLRDLYHNDFYAPYVDGEVADAFYVVSVEGTTVTLAGAKAPAVAPTEETTDAPLIYTVTWMNGDEVLETDAGLAPGAFPSYDGATPTKAADDDFTYEFDGWIFGLAFYEPDSLPIVDGDTTYVASFKATAKYEPGYYIVGTFNNWKVSTAYQLTANPENDGEYMFNDLALTTTDELKVVYAEAGKDKTRFPTGMNNNMTVTADGTYNIYFRPDGQGGEDWFEGVIYAERNIPEEVTAVTDQINALPATITADNMKDFDDVYAAYQALTDTQKEYVDQKDVDKLNNAMLAEVVVDMVSKLPENVTLSNWATVVVAGGYYDGLDDAAKAFIGEDTRRKLAAAVKTIADLQAAETVADQINALPEDITIDDKADIEAAGAAYDALTAVQKALIDEDTYKKLTDAEEALGALVLLGDADGDGMVTATDATLIQRYLIEQVDLSAAQIKAADVDRDGIVTIVDVTAIQRWLVGIEVRCPINEYV